MYQICINYEINSHIYNLLLFNVDIRQLPKREYTQKIF